MKNRLAISLMVLGFGGAILSQGAFTALAAGPHVALIELDEPILPATARFLERGIQKAADDGARVVVVTLDTPGGLIDPTRDIVTSILGSPIPVVVFVSPQGARAASAGTFITAAAHVAAMTPVSNIGAASPVGADGGNLPSTLESKVKEDAAADIRSIAEVRGRNIEALEATVMEAKSYSASEALENNIIDVVAVDLADLLAQIDGRTVCVGQGCAVIDGQLQGGSLIELQTQGLDAITVEKTMLENLLAFLANPTVTFLLLSLGALGVFIEFFLGAGMILPGIVGIIFLALAFVGMGQLPVNWVGIVLIGLSVLLFILEFQVPGTSVFGIAGVVAFGLGGLLLFGDFALPGFTPEPIEAPDLHVNPLVVAVTTAGMAAIVVFFVRSILGARTPGTLEPTSVTTLVGQTGVVTAELAPRGMVHVGGEEWSAVSDSGDTIEKGEEILVTEADGLTLKVFKSPLPHEEGEEGTPEVEMA